MSKVLDGNNDILQIWNRKKKTGFFLKLTLKFWKQTYTYANRFDRGQPTSNWAAGLRSNLFVTQSIILYEKQAKFQNLRYFIDV